ncbi:(R)-mandelonitrile lyase [Novosphingobium rosa]|uniref:(R)-mandelonitrile lyase n=1 Tax=Novosphingobium rosa TaxID=76978 RepID=UPI000A05D529|nr:cupin domain-containing protein [Novosphingobium rosa]
MKALIALAAVTLATPAIAQSAQPAHVEVYRAGSRTAVAGLPSRFTGSASVLPVFEPHDPSTVSAGTVTFQPGAHSAWHTHPRGQYLIVLSGVGWTQEEGHPIVEIHPGDVVWCPPGVKHWHGASATTGLVQLSVQEAVDGKNVEWLEKVADADYAKGPAVK